MRVVFGKGQNRRVPVYVDKEKIGFISVVHIAAQPTQESIIKENEKPSENDHMWFFFDEREDSAYIRTKVRGFIIEENDDLGRSWFEEKVANLVVKPKAKVDQLSPKALARLNRFVRSTPFEGGE